MLKPNFSRCEQAAVKLLLCQREPSLAVDVRRLKFSKKILFDTFAHYGEITGLTKEEMTEGELKDGCLIRRGELSLILYQEKGKSKRRLNWTLAHEVGHIYLEHEKDGEREEIEAHYFASQLLLPDIALVYLQKNLEILTPEMIAEFFGVSVLAARKKLETMKRNGMNGPRTRKKKFPHCFSQENQRLLDRYQPQLRALVERSNHGQGAREELSRVEEQWLYGFL